MWRECELSYKEPFKYLQLRLDAVNKGAASLCAAAKCEVAEQDTCGETMYRPRREREGCGQTSCVSLVQAKREVWAAHVGWPEMIVRWKVRAER